MITYALERIPSGGVRLLVKRKIYPSGHVERLHHASHKNPRSALQWLVSNYSDAEFFILMSTGKYHRVERSRRSRTTCKRLYEEHERSGRPCRVQYDDQPDRFVAKRPKKSTTIYDPRKEVLRTDVRRRPSVLWKSRGPAAPQITKL